MKLHTSHSEAATVKTGKCKLVERANHLAIHALFDTRSSAERFLAETVPTYCARGYYMDKTLTPSSFEIIAGY